MAARSDSSQQLWSIGEKVCLLIERESEPRFEVRVIDGEDVLREDRLYARASANMLAETWRQAATNPLSSAFPHSLAATLHRGSLR